MRITHTWLLAAGVAAASACSDDNTSPTDGGNGAAAADNVVVGNDFFRSEQNGSQDPAVDTVAAGGAVTWTWIGTGATSHSVRSEGPATFASSSIGMSYCSAISRALDALAGMAGTPAFRARCFIAINA